MTVTAAQHYVPNGGVLGDFPTIEDMPPKIVFHYLAQCAGIDLDFDSCTLNKYIDSHVTASLMENQCQVSDDRLATVLPDIATASYFCNPLAVTEDGIPDLTVDHKLVSNVTAVLANDQCWAELCSEDDINLRVEAKWIETCADVQLPYPLPSSDHVTFILSVESVEEDALLTCMLDYAMELPQSTSDLTDAPTPSDYHCFPPSFDDIQDICPGDLGHSAFEHCKYLLEDLSDQNEDDYMSMSMDYSPTPSPSEYSSEHIDNFCSILHDLSSSQGRECLTSICEFEPTPEPSASPSTPTAAPSSSWPSAPTAAPSMSPSGPTSEPSASPIVQPVKEPTSPPTFQTYPTAAPSRSPSCAPSVSPTGSQSEKPTFTGYPPAASPSSEPSFSSVPTASVEPSFSTVPSASPTLSPSTEPSFSTLPSASPTLSPSSEPSFSSVPSASPSAEPSTSVVPSTEPSFSLVPSATPSSEPSFSVYPSAAPSGDPSDAPSQVPSTVPSSSPTQFPSSTPSVSPSHAPTTSLLPTLTEVESIVTVELTSTMSLEVDTDEVPDVVDTDFEAFEEVLENAILESVSDLEGDVTVDIVKINGVPVRRRRSLRRLDQIETMSDWLIEFVLIASRGCNVANCTTFSDKVMEDYMVALDTSVSDGSMTANIQQMALNANVELLETAEVDTNSYALTGSSTTVTESETNSLPDSPTSSSSRTSFHHMILVTCLCLVPALWVAF